MDTKDSKQEVTVLGEKIMKLFGRTKKKYLALTLGLIEKLLKIERGVANYALSELISKKKIASLAGANSSIVYLSRDPKFGYEPGELINILNPNLFDKVGAYITKTVNEGEVFINDEALEEIDSGLKIPAEILKPVIMSFVEAKQIAISPKNKLFFRAKKPKILDFDSVKNAFTSANLLDLSFSDIGVKKTEIKIFSDIKKAYKLHNEKTIFSLLNSKEFFSKKDRVRIQPLTDILYGSPDLDGDFLDSIVEYLVNMPEEDRPDIISLSGLIYGSFPYRQNNKRVTLPDSVKSSGDQYKSAKLLIDKFKEAGFKMIVNKGDEDKFNVAQWTIAALESLSNFAKPLKDNKKRFINYYQINKMKQTEAWDFHLWFHWNVVEEYKLRCGRRLMTADEVGELHGRRIEEYFLLLEAYLSHFNSQMGISKFAEKVLEIENIPFPGKKFDDFVMMDDFDMEIELEGGKKLLWRNLHDMTQTGVAMLQDPTRSMREIVGQLGATQGEKVPEIFMCEHQQQAFGTIKDGCLIVLNPDLHTFRHRKSYYNVPNDSTRRKVTQRRQLFKAGAVTPTLHNDGRISFKFYNSVFMEKMGISKERIAVPIFSDWQTGSITARHDFQAKAMDYVFHRVMNKHRTHVFFNGDIKQGYNYPTMPFENRTHMLIGIDPQRQFNVKMIENCLSFLNSDVMSMLKFVGVIVGNHEYNTFYKLTGDTYSRYLYEVFEKAYAKNGLSNLKTKFYDGFYTDKGEFVRDWAGFENIAGYTLMLKHVLSGKSKGGNKPPVYQMEQQIKGAGSLLRFIDFFITGHFHHFMYLMLCNKVGLCNSSLADLSGYEMNYGYRPVPGMIVLYLGGNLPPETEWLTADFFHQYEPVGYYSKANLKKLGFKDDPGFDPVRHGFSRYHKPQSAIQKSLWSDIHDIAWPNPEEYKL